MDHQANITTSVILKEDAVWEIKTSRFAVSNSTAKMHTYGYIYQEKKSGLEENQKQKFKNLKYLRIK